MADTAPRRSPPAQRAKIATAGATGVFVFGLAAVMGWSPRSANEPVPATTVLVPLATTIPTTPIPVPVPQPAPAEVVPTAPPPPAPPPSPPPPAPPAPVIVVSEQSQ